MNPTLTPNLKGILVTLSRSSNGFGNELTEKALYTIKQQEFDGTTWRKMRKIYPIEICPKEAEIYYFAFWEEAYTYKNGDWINCGVEPFNDIEANWIFITQNGMTAEELRSIPEEAFQNDFAGKSFIIVYCMKVYDTSTKEYNVKAQRRLRRKPVHSRESNPQSDLQRRGPPRSTPG